MIKMYLVISLIANALLVFFFDGSLSVTKGSLLPAFLLCLMIFLSIFHYQNRGKFDFNSSNFSDISDEEWQKVSVCISRSLLIFAPFNIPFVLFFNDYIKMFSAFTIIIGYIAGPTCYKINNRR